MARAPYHEETPAERSKRMESERQARIDACPVKKTDLTHLTCDPREPRRTWVSLEWDFDTRIEWLIFGPASMHSQSDRRDGDRWRLEGSMARGVTDFEHSTALAVRLPLVGLQLGFVSHGQVRYTAFVDSSSMVYDPADPKHSEFHVPSPGYDPRKHKDTYKCDTKGCSDKGHLIIPEGFYVPPFNLELFQHVRGKKVEIVMGIKHEE
jgi:hypothetical protein